MCKELFDTLDCHGTQVLDDIQFLAFMKHATNLNTSKILKLFETLDVDDSQEMDFDEFYLLVCMLIAVKDHLEKEFLNRHSRTCFELLDGDASRTIEIEEFETFGYLFNISKRASRKIFAEFDVDGSDGLSYEEFSMFALACVEEQQGLDRKRKLEQTENIGVIASLQNRCILL
jgi:Ca2+-binding EF-hand superfamily protein